VVGQPAVQLGEGREEADEGVGGGELVQQVVQGAAAGVVGDGRAVAVKAGVAQPRDAGAGDEAVGAKAEDEGGRAAGVVESGPPDGIDPRVVRSLVG
jgi:hypothetical protein